MLAKVNRARRHSVHGAPTTSHTTTSSQHPPPRIECAPELTRWCDLSIPFTPVAFGGYTKYYLQKQTHVQLQQQQVSPTYSPKLAYCGRELQVLGGQRPVAYPLFTTVHRAEHHQHEHQEDHHHHLHQRPLVQASSSSSSEHHLSVTASLAVIREVSKETIGRGGAGGGSATGAPSLASTSTATRVRNLSISTTATAGTSSSPHSLRRKRRQLLRTPSVERDFAPGTTASSLFGSSKAGPNGGGGVIVNGLPGSASTCTSASGSSRSAMAMAMAMEVSLSHDSTNSSSTDQHSDQSHASGSSFSSTLTSSSSSELSSEGGPITPTTSVGDQEEEEDDDHGVISLPASPWEDMTEGGFVLVPTTTTGTALQEDAEIMTRGGAGRTKSSIVGKRPPHGSRPDSGASFRTAKSSLDSDGVPTPNWTQTEMIMS